MKHFILLLAAVVCLAVNAATKPNYLIILADDCTYNDLPVYGGENAKTPNIDRLAAEGLVFSHAYLGIAMCQPCRSELYSGLYPMGHGATWNHSASRPAITSLPHHLGTLGYRTGLSGKEHIKPKKCFPFEEVGGFDKSCVRNPTQPHATEFIEEFMTRSADPFCLVVALVEPHVPWVMGDAAQYPPAKLKLPANMADTPKTREAFARYLAEITYMDAQVGDILAALKKSGRERETLVLFSSEQGSQFPGNKWTNWDTGVHTALIARWPEKVKAGERSDALIQYCDVAPTLVELAGGDPSGFGYDGGSFSATLLDPSRTHREFVYAMHNNVPEGPAYPVRSVSNGRFRYIRNLTPEAVYIERHLMGLVGDGLLNNPYWGTWIYFAGENPRTGALVSRYLKRPAEQLYRTSSDPYEMNNLAGVPEFGEVQRALSAKLDEWMKAEGDPGVPLDTAEALEAARAGKHLY